MANRRHPRKRPPRANSVGATITLVRLFTPVSQEEADALERGVPLRHPLYWMTRLEPEEATEDAIWVVLTIPDEELATDGVIEQPVNPGLGYREWKLPPGLPAGFPVKRIVRPTA